MNEGLKEVVECGGKMVGVNCDDGGDHMEESLRDIELGEEG